MLTKIFLTPLQKAQHLKRKALGYITKYKKQQNLAVKLNRETKLQYFDNLESSKNSKPFWDKCRNYFPNKHAHAHSKIILIEWEEITRNTNEIVKNGNVLVNNGELVNNDEIIKNFNKHYTVTVEKYWKMKQWPRSSKNFKTTQVSLKVKLNTW